VRHSCSMQWSSRKGCNMSGLYILVYSYVYTVDQ
jgi:hypothetical protein